MIKRYVAQNRLYNLAELVALRTKTSQEKNIQTFYHLLFFKMFQIKKNVKKNFKFYKINKAKLTWPT